MISEFLLYGATALLLAVVYSWFTYRDRRKRRIRHCESDLIHHTVLLLVTAKKFGHIEGDLPEYESLKEAVSSDLNEDGLSTERFAESLQFCANISKYPELLEHVKGISTSALKLSFAKAPGKTGGMVLFFSGLLGLALGVHTFHKRRKQLDGLTASLLSKLPVRYC